VADARSVWAAADWEIPAAKARAATDRKARPNAMPSSRSWQSVLYSQ